MENKGKSLDEILKRNDYVKLVPQLRKRVEYIAKIIRQKMVELDLDQLSIEEKGIKIYVSVNCVKAGSFGEYEYLGYVLCNDYRRGYSLEDVGHEYYYAGDFNALVRGASNRQALHFLNCASEIIRQLGEYEEYLNNDIDKSLKESSELHIKTMEED